MGKKYSEEVIQELLDWVKERLEKKDYFTEVVRLDVSTQIFNSAAFLQAMLTTVQFNWKNPIFYPLIDKLCLYKDMWEKKASN